MAPEMAEKRLRLIFKDCFIRRIYESKLPFTLNKTIVSMKNIWISKYSMVAQGMRVVTDIFFSLEVVPGRYTCPSVRPRVRYRRTVAPTTPCSSSTDRTVDAE